MPEQTFLPYRAADSALETVIDTLMLDGDLVAVDEYADLARHQILLSASGNWRTASLRLTVKDPNESLESVVHDGEDPRSVLRLLAVSRGGDGRIRCGVELEPQGPGWIGEVVVERPDHRGVVHLECVAVRRLETEPRSGLAARFGEKVAWAPRWSIYLDDRAAIPGGAIEGEWKDFSSGDAPAALRQRQDCLWHLDLGNSEKPRLYLNEGVEGFRRALEAPQRTGRAARIRDSLAHSVLQPVLTSMAVTAITSAESTEFEDLEGWRQDLLRSLGRSSEHKTEEQQVEEWLEAWRAKDAAGVMGELATAVQKHLKVGRAASYLVKELEGGNVG